MGWAGTEISKGAVAACHPGSITWSMWALPAPRADSPWKKGFDLIQIMKMAEIVELEEFVHQDRPSLQLFRAWFIM